MTSKTFQQTGNKITTEEVSKIIKRLPKDKATGIDEVPADSFSTGEKSC